jgi:pimeloyl-ACP methyl ester carboxylesterase
VNFLSIIWFSALFLCLSSTALGQKRLEHEVFVKTHKDTLFGTILLPNGIIDTSQVVVLIIAGSGPTDRNGNNPAMTNNSLKLLADELAKLDIASLRYDKRGVAASSAAFIREDSLTFQNNVDDAAYWIEVLSNFGYSNIIVAGHSEGALVGLLLANQQPKVKKYISIAGAGRPIDEVLKEQYTKMAPVIRDSAYSIIDSLKKGVVVERLSPWLFSVFRPSVQPYIISWMQIDPRQEMTKLTQPALIVQGTTDVQVSVQDAHLLAASQPTAQLSIIKQMNHVLKKVPDDKGANRDSYNNPSLLLHPELIMQIFQFIVKDN